MGAVRAERDLAAQVRATVASARKSPVLPLVLVDWEATASSTVGGGG